MNYAFIKLFSEILLCLLFSILIMIPVHEVGHLLGGIASGYKLTMLEICGLKITKKTGRIKIRYRRGLPSGQCIMHPKCISQNCVPLIAGGILANFIFGSVLVAAGLFAFSQFQMIFLICSGGMNIAAGVMSWAGSNDYCDGSTLKEVMNDSRRISIYNRLMLIYTELEYGKGYAELSEYLFDSSDIYNSSLSAELAMFRLMKTVAGCKKGIESESDVKVAKLMYERHRKATEIEGVIPDE